jgi:hypothetical protein
MPDEQITPRDYWRGRWRWAKANTKLWTADKFVSGPIVAIIALALQWREGIRLMIPTIQIAITVVGAYGIVLFGSLLMNWLYYAPVALERERREEIARIGTDLEKFRNPEKLISFQFERMDFGNRASTPIIVVRLQITNRGPAITIHGIRLCSDADPKIRYSPRFNGFAEPSTGIDFIRLDSNHVCNSFLEFNGSRTKQTWVLEYSDASHPRQRETIPPALYAD